MYGAFKNVLVLGSLGALGTLGTLGTLGKLGTLGTYLISSPHRIDGNVN